MFLLLLCILSAVLMSLPWLVPSAGFTALVGLVPLLLMELYAQSRGMKRIFWWSYLAFFMWNFATTFWVCNATIGGGIFASLANAFQMALVFALFRLSKKRFGGRLPYLFLVCLWIAWEKLYFSAEISWPWLTLGNAFGRTTRLAQFYEYTGSLGGSLWIWASNLAVFFLICDITGGASRSRRAFDGALAAIVLLGPAIWSEAIYHSYQERSEGTLEVVIGQPNFDPYHKFESMTQEQQNQVLLRLFGSQDLAAGQTPLLLLAPETFTSDIRLNDIRLSRTWNSFQEFLIDKPGVNMLFGAATHELIERNARPSWTARRIRDGLWAQGRNSALVIDNTGRTEIFHKSKLVVGVEKTPYPAIFSRIDDMLGGVMGRDIGQDEVSLLNVCAYDTLGAVCAKVPLGCAVCYESIYGDYCRGYVQKGAQAMTVITNDAWWGDTPGYRQHLSYSSLRAIELRRDIARCGNTGISAFIDQRGDIVSESGWWQEAVLRGGINLNSRQTVFVRCGDVVGRICTLCAALMALALLVMLAIRRR